MPIVPHESARRAAENALTRLGAPPTHAVLQADLLVEAELRGRASHGLMRLPRIVERIAAGVTDPRASGRHDWLGEAFLAVDGQDGLGPVVACAALDRLCARVRKTGIALAAISRNNHLGMLAWYAERATRRGFSLIALTTSEALTHPWGGRRAMLGTNPIAIGVPAQPKPFILDMATSRVSMGEIHDHARRGQPIPAGWALDSGGAPTIDATAATAGAIAPFGEAKGYALALAFELLVAGLTASALGREVRGTLDSTEPCTKGDVFILMDARASEDMAPALGRFLDLLRAEAPAEGFAGVAVPGDRSTALRAARLAGGLPLDDDMWSRITALSGRMENVD